MKITSKCLLALLAVGMQGSLAAFAQQYPASSGGGAQPMEVGAPYDNSMDDGEGRVQLGGNADEGRVIITTQGIVSPPVPAAEGVIVDPVPGTMLDGTNPLVVEELAPPTDGGVIVSDPSGSVSSTPSPAYEPTSAPYSAVYDPAFNVNSGVGYAVTQDISRVLFRFEKWSGDLLGVENGHSQFGAFVPLHSEGGQRLLFGDLRGYVTDEGRGGANVGIGRRYYDPSIDQVLEISGWYDYDDSHSRSYQQLGYSFAWIGRYLSFRTNGYFPIGTKSQLISEERSTANLVGGQLLVDILRTSETSFRHFDFEFAAPTPFIGRYGFEWAAGGYYIEAADGPEESDFGARGRFDWHVTEDVNLNVIVTNDNIFGTNASLNVALTIPDGMPSRIARPRPVRDYYLSTTRRNFRIPAQISSTRNQEVATRADGSAIQIGVLDPNDNPTGRNGQFDVQFTSLEDYASRSQAEREDVDILFVLRRDDGSDINLNTTISLLDDQRLLGEGVDHVIQIGGDLVTLGATNAGAVPLLTNSAAGGDVVTLADNNLVSGFTINASGAKNALGMDVDPGDTARGVVGVGINSFALNRLTIEGVTDGVDITHTGTGTGRLQNTTITGDGAGSVTGFSLEHSSGTLDLLISALDPTLGDSVTITGFQGEDRDGDGINDAGEDTNGNGILDSGEDDNNNGILDPPEDSDGDGFEQGTGIILTATGTGSVINAGQMGVVDPLDPTIIVVPTDQGIFNTTVTDNGSGVLMQALSGGTFNLVAQNNNWSSNVDESGFGFSMIADGGTFNLFDFSNNTVDSNDGDGGRILATNGGTFTSTGVISNNSFSNNGFDGLDVVADGTTVTLASINGNVLNNNGENGLSLRAINNGTILVTAPLEANSLVGNGGDGVFTLAAPGTVFADIGQGNNISGNGTNPLLLGAGFSFNVDAGGVITTSVVNLTSNNNAGSGFAFRLNNGGIINLTEFRGNTAVNNGQFGVVIVNNGGTFTTPVFADSNLSNNGNRALNPNFDDNDGAGLFITGVADGIPALVDLGTVTNNNFNRTTTGSEGILFDTVNVDITGTITNNRFIADSVANLDAGRGIGGNINGGSLNLLLTRDATATGPNMGQNIFTGSVDAHIGLTFFDNDADPDTLGDSVNSIVIENHVLQGAVDGALNNFFGEGVALLLDDNARLTGAIRDSIIGLSNANPTGGNAGNGIRLTVAGQSFGTGAPPFVPIFAAVNDFEISGNLIAGNALNGIKTVRTANGRTMDITISDNLIGGNGFDGIEIESVNNMMEGFPGSNIVDTYTISDNVIGQFIAPATLTAGELAVAGNGLNGIHLIAGADAQLNVDINGNLIDGNLLNGIAYIDDFNDASDFRTLSGVWQANMIVNNAEDGIELAGHVGETRRDPADDTTVVNPDLLIGALTDRSLLDMSLADRALGNIIEGNGADGIEFGVYDAELLRDAVVGTDPATGLLAILPVPGAGVTFIDRDLQLGLQFPFTLDDSVDPGANNTISFNDPNNIRGSGRLTIAHNQIQRNGDIANETAGDNNSGIDINVGKWDYIVFADNDNFTPSNDADSLNSTQFPNVSREVEFTRQAFVTIFGNDINDNRGDGIEIFNSGNLSINEVDSPVEVLIRSNRITNNDRRGIDILVAASNVLAVQPGFNDGMALGFDFPGFLAASNTLIDIDRNTVANNGSEGIYAVLTNSSNPQIGAGATATPFADNTGQNLPSIVNLPRNGSDLTSVQLGINVTNNEIIANGSGSDFSATGLVLRVGTSGGGYSFVNPGGFASDGNGNFTGFGGVIANVVNNDFDGNFGDDILFQDFTSTFDPPTTTGTWTDDMFSVNTYNADPLSRLDLVFIDNDFKSADLGNLVGVSSGLQTMVAFYDNAEPVFKSRLGSQTPGGPFGNAARRRNARRQGFRDGLPPDPATSPDNGIFLFPGLGPSTFRVSTGSDLIFFMGPPIDPTSADNLLDEIPFNDIFDANGYFLPGGGTAPYGFGQF